MPSLLIIALVFYSSLSMAKTSECYREVSQADKNECMAFEKNKAIGKLMKKVTEYCADKGQVSDSKGGSIYPMVLDDCMTKEILELAQEVEN